MKPEIAQTREQHDGAHMRATIPARACRPCSLACSAAIRSMGCKLYVVCVYAHPHNALASGQCSIIPCLIPSPLAPPISSAPHLRTPPPCPPQAARATRADPALTSPPTRGLQLPPPNRAWLNSPLKHPTTTEEA
eukprot:scaffold6305_cov116-Isochrysis_galbana.AAC.4